MKEGVYGAFFLHLLRYKLWRVANPHYEAIYFSTVTLYTCT